MNAGRFVPLTARFLKEVATQLDAADPVAAAWTRFTAPEITPDQPATPPLGPTQSRRAKSPPKDPGREIARTGAIETWLHQEPDSLMNTLRAAVVSGEITLRSSVPAALTPVIDQLGASFEERGLHTPYEARTIASEFVRAVQRYIVTAFGATKAPLETSSILPHAQRYYQDVMRLEEAGFIKPFRRALAQSFQDIQRLHSHWVRIAGVPEWQFAEVVNGSVFDIQEALQKLHQTQGTDTPAPPRSSRATLERDYVAAHAVLATEPEVLLKRMRQATRDYKITSWRSPTIASKDVTEAFEEWLVQRSYEPTAAKTIATDYIKAIFRLVNLETGAHHAGAITLDMLLPHIHLYLEQAEQLGWSGLPNAYRHARAYSPRDVYRLYQYWVGEKKVPAWVFVRVASTHRIDLAAGLQRSYDRFGPNLPPLPGLQPLSLGRLFAFVTGEDMPGASEQFPPEELYIEHETPIENYRLLSQMLRKLPYNEALAVIITYDLKLAGNQSIDISRVSRRLGIPTTELPAYVEQHVLPKLRKIGIS